MNSIKELKEQLGYEEIGLDDIFVFHCTQCGKCCIHREDILLSPKDLFHIAKKLKITPEVALAQYCETYLGRNSHIPVVRLLPKLRIVSCHLSIFFFPLLKIVLLYVYALTVKIPSIESIKCEVTRASLDISSEFKTL